MSHATLVRAAMAAFAILMTAATAADAQILRRAREAAQRAAEREVVKTVDEKVTEVVTCVLGDRSCIEKARSEGREVQIVDSAGEPVVSAFVNFDFVPGERVLFTDDFSADVVGDFPRRLQHDGGNMEVAEWRNGRWLRGTSWPGTFSVTLPEVLPERFTVEMEVVPGQNNQWLKIQFAENAPHHVGARYFQNVLAGGVLTVSKAVADGRTAAQVAPGTPFMLRIMADGNYVKVYVDGTRVANVPNAQIGRSNAIRIEMPGSTDEASFVRGIRVAAGGRALYDALNETGRVATQGIYFDTNSDVIRPESAPTLNEIAQMLTSHPELRITIEGHTDSTGNAAANQQLSERRANAVLRALIEDHGIRAERLDARGLGATKPATTNDTAEGRQQNRRVELVRM